VEKGGTVKHSLSEKEGSRVKRGEYFRFVEGLEAYYLYF
jgi:hypothetical protein